MHKKLLYFSALMILNIPYLISVFIPKKKNLWVFGAWFGDKYADNSRHLFEYIVKNRPDIQAIWLTDSEQVFSKLATQGYDVRYKKSFYGYWAALRSRYQFICCGLNDVFLYGYQLARPKIIQLWHGIPIKKVLMSDEAFKKKHTAFSYKIKSFLFPGTKFFFHAVPASSDYVYDLYSNDTFNGLTKNFLKIGQARNNILIEGQHSHRAKKILYAPTHRNNKLDIDSGAFAYLNSFPSLEELKEIDQICHEYGYEFIIKLHFYAEKYIDFLKIDTYKCIKKSVAEDINHDLIESSLLITDISSCIFDYALLDRTLFICFPDFSVYQANNRDLYCSPNTLVDDEFVFYTWRDCIKSLKKTLASDNLPKNTKSIAEKYNSYSLEGKSCQKIVDFLTEGRQLT